MIVIIKHVFKLQFLLIITAILAGVYYPQVMEVLKKQVFLFSGKHLNGSSKSIENLQNKNMKIFTKEELLTYNGENGMPIYLALLGRVYDVTKGARHYGPTCSYSYFAGRDASVSFITGNFENYVEAEADDVLSLRLAELLSLANWQTFYERDYTLIGKLVGRFYNAVGEPTVYNHKFYALLEQAQADKSVSDQLRLKYPDCNIEWSNEKGSHVWCTRSSGGIERDWIGYPRKLFQVGSDTFRCACLQEEDLDTKEVMVKTYDDCETLAYECYYHVD